MGIRKFISLLLLVAFTLQLAPANAAIYSSGGATLPTIVQDPGTKANGANREVVPVTIKVDNISPGELLFTRASLTDGAGVSSVAASITANGKLAFTAFNGSASVASISQRMFVLQPPTGSQFVGLNIDGYTSSLTSSVITNGSSATPQYVNVSGVGTSDTVLPGGTGDAGANFILAGVLTENGPASYFGSIVPKGSIVVHPVTFAAVAETHTGPLVALNLTNFGLVADPSGNTTLSGSLTASNFTPTGSSPATTGSLTLTNTGLTVATATTAPAAGKLETAKLAAEDSEPNVVLASRLASGSSTIKIGPGLKTSTGTGLTALNVDTDAIIIRARERAESTASAKAYYQTPFATSAFVPGQTLSANGATSIAVLNTALTNATKFPNTDNARITVTFKAVNPTTGADSDATLVVNAVNVSLYGDKALDEVRDVTGNETTSAALEGWLGALSLGTNGTSSASPKYGLGVIYNGTSATSALVVKDATPSDYSEQSSQLGYPSANNTSVPNSATPATITNATTTAGIFPGSLVAEVTNGNTAGWTVVSTANGSGATPYTFTTEIAIAQYNAGSAIYTPGEVTARLVSGAANAWFTILGNESVVAVDDGRDLTVGATNLSNVAPTKAPIVNADGTTYNAANNAVVVANLTDKVLTILPLTNRYDGLRDALSVRPEMTLTLGTNSRTQGVKIVAVISGGNIGTSEEVVVAEILAAGSLSTSFTLQTLPVDGNLTGLMAENGTNASFGRASILLSNVTGASTTTDSISDLVSALGTNRALDTTVPPLFCGGTAGTGKFGPNKVIFQPKARTVLVTESAADQFKAISDLNTARLRITLPAGWDLNAYNGSLAASQIVSLITTGVGSTFTVAPSIVRIQPRNVNAGSTGTDAAFIDINVGTPGTTTQAVLRSIGLVFKPNALVAPAGTTDFNATVTVIDAGAANTRGASIADDTVLSTVGTVALADSCSTFLAVSYCPSAISSYQDTSAITSGLTQAEVLANGASLTSFSGTVGGTSRYVGNTNTVSLPDICISEGIADAFPIGAVTDGVPTQFGEVAMGAEAGKGVLHLASSFDGTDDAGLSAPGTARVIFSDSTMTATGITSGNNDVSVVLTDGTSTTQPFTATSTVRLRGLTMDGSTETLPAAQNFIAWFEAVTGAGDQYAIGNNVAKQYKIDSVNGSAIVSVVSSTNESEKMAAVYRNGDLADTTLALDTPNLTTTADLTTYFANSSAPTIASAVVRTLDTSAIKVLTESTVLSVSVSNITGSTDKLVEVSAAAGSLQAGTLITATTTATGGTAADTVLVPVLADGSFKLTVRSTATGLITLTQGPVSAATRTPAQVTRYLEVADQNVDPAITAAVAQDIGLGTVSEKGKVPVVFQVTSTGKSGGVDFVPTASQLTLGGAPVTAVTGSTNKFIGLVDFAKSNALDVVCTVGSEVSTVELTELDSEAATKLGAPTLTGVRNNTAGFIVLKGQRLRNGQTFGFVLNDGTFQAVTLRNQTKNEAKTLNRRSAAAETIPANAAYAVFSVPDRGVASKAIVTE